MVKIKIDHRRKGSKHMRLGGNIAKRCPYIRTRSTQRMESTHSGEIIDTG